LEIKDLYERTKYLWREKVKATKERRSGWIHTGRIVEGGSQQGVYT
jgi:hypothetical protein